MDQIRKPCSMLLINFTQSASYEALPNHPASQRGLDQQASFQSHEKNSLNSVSTCLKVVNTRNALQRIPISEHCLVWGDKRAVYAGRSTQYYRHLLKKHVESAALKGVDTRPAAVWSRYEAGGLGSTSNHEGGSHSTGTQTHDQWGFAHWMRLFDVTRPWCGARPTKSDKKVESMTRGGAEGNSVLD